MWNDFSEIMKGKSDTSIAVKGDVTRNGAEREDCSGYKKTGY